MVVKSSYLLISAISSVIACAAGAGWGRTLPFSRPDMEEIRRESRLAETDGRRDEAEAETEAREVIT